MIFKLKNLKFKDRTSLQVLWIIIILLLIQSCVQSPQSKRTTLKSATTSSPTTSATPKAPDFSSGFNFVQNGASTYNSNIPLQLTFSDFLQLRGSEIDNYIRINGSTNVSCLTSKFTQSGVSKIIVMAAIPRSVFNFQTQTLEYYFNLTPNDSTNNQNFCQKTGLITKLNSLYSTLTPKYKISEICPTGTCSNASYSSEGIELYSSSGIAITQITTRQLFFLISNSTNGPSSTSQTCTESNQCKAIGYDCCSLGQCVKDLALKPGIDVNSIDYKQALQEILNNPTSIYLYPQYYFICSVPVNTPTTTEPTTDPLNAAYVRLKKLKDLYTCTTKIEGEYGVCSITHKNAKTFEEDPTKFYSARGDDTNFAFTFTNLNVLPSTLVSIEQVSFGEVVLYDYSSKTDDQLKLEPFIDSGIISIIGNHNDDLETPAKIQVMKKPASAVSSDLVIKYKIDASCISLNTKLAKCEKYYIQEQSDSGDNQAAHRQGRVTDHATDNTTKNNFKLPRYADTNKTISVEVDGVIQKRDIDWQLLTTTANYVQFLPVSSLQVFKDQKVKITFFVDAEANPGVMVSKNLALEEIQALCSCPDKSCSLTPVKNVAGVITDYACVYPDPQPVIPPLSQKIFLSSKTIPVRFFDESGTSKKTVSASDKQEGSKFEYRSGNLLNPNNKPDITNSSLTSLNNFYIGFNEIYGSINYTNSSAKPAYEVGVKKGTMYDIYVDRGALSNCVQCGNDYYSQLTKLFPLTQFGGGVKPILGQTNRTMSNGVRSDDMKFGRACLVPATMLPWSHNPESSGAEQRLNRMSAQHFLYANGYQYDWYGFDYGSVIGSFDGVKWFSVGSNRRIKAETNKMFLAINAPMADLTLEATYEVTVNDGSLNPLGTNIITKDYDSDGAECQQFHQCSTDNDCATTLGWEYSCAPVNEITTKWPLFDDNAKEVPEATLENNKFSSIINASSTGKRCIYRGRGALCTPNYSSITESSQTFNQSTNKAYHGCSANNYCQPISVNGTSAPKFNNRIVRYGKVRTDSTVDSFGLGALIPGRPFAYQGEETPTGTTLKNLSANKSLAMCLPGRNVEISNFLDQNKTIPSGTEYMGDKTLGMGMTFRKNTPSAAANYLMSCSIMDSTKNYYFNITSSASTDFSNLTQYPSLKYDAGSQALSTNALAIFNTIFSNKSLTFPIFKNNTTVLSTPSFTENRCLRAPGASCFSDLDCGPSKTIADKIKSLSINDTNVLSLINKYEVLFWQEELICSQSIKKDDSLYDPKNNRCCRDVGKIISIPSGDATNDITYSQVAGIDYAMNSSSRYSRAASLYKEVKTLSTTYPDLSVAIKDQCSVSCQSTASLPNQFKSFSTLAEKTSCTGDWVRNFAIGGHKWESTRHQIFNPSIFKCFNWYPGDGGYTCEGLEKDDPACGIVQTPPSTSKARGIFDFLGKMELTGIPQIAIEAETFFDDPNEEFLSCKSSPAGRSTTYPNHPTLPAANYAPPQNIFASPATVKEYNDTTKGQMYSAADSSNFKTGFKQVFKSDEVVSCYPAGTQMKAGDDPTLCCTGMINSSNNKCQLPDYVDLSVYTNRYVSSEAKKLNATLFDTNGYIKDPDYVASLACEKSMCASNAIAYGILVSRLKTPGQPDMDNKYFRFIDGSLVDNENGLLDVFNKGLKINSHAYCIPQGLAESASNSDDLRIVTCGN
jgi:hypothetical protein